MLNEVLWFEKFYLFNVIFFKVKLVGRVLGWDLCKNMQYVSFGLKGNHCLDCLEVNVIPVFVSLHCREFL